jgi:hypothetical protein
MNNVSLSRELVNQVLGAFRMCVPMDGRHAEVDAAFRNLRAALAQQAEPVEVARAVERAHNIVE